MAAIVLRRPRLTAPPQFPVELDTENIVVKRLGSVLRSVWIPRVSPLLIYGAVPSVFTGTYVGQNGGLAAKFGYGARMDNGVGWTGRVSGAQYGYRGAIIVGRTNGLGSGGLQDWWCNSNDDSNNWAGLNSSSQFIATESGYQQVTATDNIQIGGDFSLAFSLGTANSQYQRVALNGVTRKDSTAAVGDGWSGWTGQMFGSASWPVDNTCAARISMVCVLDGPIDIETLRLASANPWQLVRPVSKGRIIPTAAAGGLIMRRILHSVRTTQPRW